MLSSLVLVVESSDIEDVLVDVELSVVENVLSVVEVVLSLVVDVLSLVEDPVVVVVESPDAFESFPLLVSSPILADILV